jgi:signal transduction histidine kinase
MGPWRLPSVRWPLLLLLASLGFTTLGVVEANRAIRSQQTVTAHALQDYAGFVSWSYQQHLRELLGAATQEILGAVNHGEGMHTHAVVPSASSLPHYLPWNAQCACHRPIHGPSPTIYFAYVLGSDTLGYVVNARSEPAEGWEVDRPLPEQSAARVSGYTAAERHWINDTLTKQIRHGGSDIGRFPIVVATHDSLPRLLTYTLMPTSWGDTLVYGAEYAHAAFTGFLADVMYDRNLLPATFTRGHAVNEVVQLRVSDVRGNTLFESEPVREWKFDDTTRLPAAFGSLQVRAQIRRALAGNIVIGGLPRSRLPFLLGMLAVAAALGIVAFGQLRREGELARLRENFVANISHELRTPLAQMRLYIETLRLGRFTTEDQRAWSLDNVERETTRLTQLVERVLRFSRTGRPDDDSREKVDTAAEVQRIVEEFQPLAAARGARVTLEAEPVAPLLLRPAALRHLVLNVLDNAVKYGPTGQIIHVRVRQPNGEVRIEVADQGPGIAAAERTKVWKPYQRGRTAGHTAGSGIGLAVVRDVAAAHGGRAWIEDPPSGVGALFVIALPAAGETAPATTTAKPLAPTPHPSLG